MVGYLGLFAFWGFVLGIFIQVLSNFLKASSLVFFISALFFCVWGIFKQICVNIVLAFIPLVFSYHDFYYRDNPEENLW